MIENVKYSALKVAPEKRPYKLASLSQSLESLYAAAMQEEFFIDDFYKQANPRNVLSGALMNGEFFLSKSDGDVVGFLLLRGILPGRHAFMEAYALPKYRGPEGKEIIYACFKEVVDYAFSETGLGLKKIKAEICQSNLPALVTCEALGFLPIGMSPLDQFHLGAPYDTVLLELLNPDYFGLEPETLNNGREQQSTIGAAIHAADAIPTGASLPEPDLSGTRGLPVWGESSRGDDHGSGDGDATDAGSDERESVGQPSNGNGELAQRGSSAGRKSS